MPNGSWSVNDYLELLAKAQAAFGDAPKEPEPQPAPAVVNEPAPAAEEEKPVAVNETPPAKEELAEPTENDYEHIIHDITPPAVPDEPERAAQDDKTIVFAAKNGGEEIDSASPGGEDTSPTRLLPEPFDRPGGIVQNPQHTGEAPTILTASALGEMVVLQERGSEESAPAEGQLRFEGFEDKPVPKVDEHTAENQLNGRRREKLRDFRVETPKTEASQDVEADGGDDDDEFNNTKDDSSDTGFEYRDPNERDSTYRVFLNSDQKSGAAVLRLVGLAIFGGVLAGLSLFAEGGVSGIENNIFSMGSNVFCLALLGYFCYRDIFGGLSLLFRGQGDGDSAFALAYLLALSVGVLPLFLGSLSVPGAALFSLPVLFMGLWNAAAKNAILHNLTLNFQEWAYADSSGRDIYAVHLVTDKKDAAAMCADLRGSTTNKILVSQQILFPSGFRKESEDTAAVDKLFRILLPFAGGVALLLSAAVYLINKNLPLAVALLPASFTALLPMPLLAAQTIPLKRMRRQLKEDRAMLASVGAAKRIAQADAFAIDAVELYLRNECEMRMPQFASPDIKIFDVMLYITAMLREMDGPAVISVQNSVSDKDIPRLRDVCVESQGITAKIPQGFGMQAVLLGTLKHLELHQVKGLPNELDENAKWSSLRLKVLYFAMGDEYIACIPFSYRPARHLDRLRELTGDGMRMLVATRDPNITEEEIVRSFKLANGLTKRQDAVRIAKTIGEEAFQKYRLQAAQKGPAAALHDGSAHSYFSLIAAARRLTRAAKRTSLAQLLLMAAWTLVFAVGILLGLDPAVALLSLLGLQLGGTLLLLLLGRA